jgi:fatty acid desaturase
MRTLQTAALAQLACNAAIIYVFGQTKKGLHSLLFWWISPILCGYPVVKFIRNLEHGDCEVSNLSNNCLRNTRSVRSNIVVHTLLWDTNFHAEHHCYPMVPSRRSQ